MTCWVRRAILAALVVGRPEGLVEAVGVQALGATQHRGQGLEW